MKDRRKIIVGGDEFEVMDEGNCFIETKRKRFEWREGELKRFAVREKFGKPGKDGKRMVEPIDWGFDHFAGSDVVELYGPDYDKGRGHRCWVRLAGVDGPVDVPSPKIDAAVGEPDSKQQVKMSKQRRHGPDNRTPYNRRNNPELGNQLRAWFRKPENKDATPHAGAVWAESLFNRKDGCLKGWKLPCKKTLWKEAKKQKLKARCER